MKRRREVDGENRIPALDRKLLDRPRAAWLSMAAISIGLDTSAALWLTGAPYADTSASAASMAALEPKPLRSTAAPCVASVRAMPSPIPLVEPVTTATRPFNVIVMAGIEPRRARRWPLDLGSTPCLRVVETEPGQAPEHAPNMM